MMNWVANFDWIWTGWSLTDAAGLLDVGLVVAATVFILLSRRRAESSEQDLDESLERLLQSALNARDAGCPIEPDYIAWIEDIIASRKRAPSAPLGPKLN